MIFKSQIFVLFLFEHWKKVSSTYFEIYKNIMNFTKHDLITSIEKRSRFFFSHLFINYYRFYGTSNFVCFLRGCSIFFLFLAGSWRKTALLKIIFILINFLSMITLPPQKYVKKEQILLALNNEIVSWFLLYFRLWYPYQGNNWQNLISSGI